MVKKIGLTGGIGSGKSFFAALFRQLDIPIYSSDHAAKRLMNEEPVIVEGIKKIFGSKAYTSDSLLDRKHIAAQIFNDKDKLAKINSLVHPAVREDFSNWAMTQKAPFVINEAALFVENGTYKDFDALVTVLSPLELRIKRIIQRDQISREQVLQRIKNQSSDKDKIAVSQYLLYNDAVISPLIQVRNLYHLISNSN